MAPVHRVALGGVEARVRGALARGGEIGSGDPRAFGGEARGEGPAVDSA